MGPQLPSPSLPSRPTSSTSVQSSTSTSSESSSSSLLSSRSSSSRYCFSSTSTSPLHPSSSPKRKSVKSVLSPISPSSLSKRTNKATSTHTLLSLPPKQPSSSSPSTSGPTKRVKIRLAQIQQYLQPIIIHLLPLEIFEHAFTGSPFGYEAWETEDWQYRRDAHWWKSPSTRIPYAFFPASATQCVACGTRPSTCWSGESRQDRPTRPHVLSQDEALAGYYASVDKYVEWRTRGTRTTDSLTVKDRVTLTLEHDSHLAGIPWTFSTEEDFGPVPGSTKGTSNTTTTTTSSSSNSENADASAPRADRPRRTASPMQPWHIASELRRQGTPLTAHESVLMEKILLRKRGESHGLLVREYQEQQQRLLSARNRRYAPWTSDDEETDEETDLDNADNQSPFHDDKSPGPAVQATAEPSPDPCEICFHQRPPPREFHRRFERRSWSKLDQAEIDLFYTIVATAQKRAAV